MFSQFFGTYLLNSGMLTRAQLCEALNYEKSVKVKLGILAINAGAMTAKQVEKVHSLQRVKDQKFGMLAVDLGYLTPEQVETLLTMQGKDHLTLMQAIADKGYMSLAAVEKALEDFREEYGITEQNFDNDNEIIKKLVDFSSAGAKAELLYDYLGLLLRNIVRLLNDTPYISTQAKKIAQTPAYFVSQRIYGDISVETGLEMGEPVLLELANRFYGEKLAAVDELALDSAGEFMNVHNGLFCSTLSNNGIRADLDPQAIRVGDADKECRSYCVTIGTSFGQIELVLN